MDCAIDCAESSIVPTLYRWARKRSLVGSLVESLVHTQLFTVWPASLFRSQWTCSWRLPSLFWFVCLCVCVCVCFIRKECDPKLSALSQTVGSSSNQRVSSLPIAGPKKKNLVRILNESSFRRNAVSSPFPRRVVGASQA